MSELIDRQALKDYVSSLSTHPMNEWDTWGVIAAIDKQPTITASPWRRVEDGLPPKATWVLTVATDGNVKIFNIATVDAGGQWWTYSPQNILRELYGVRYWMPIEPPKEENHESL